MEINFNHNEPIKCIANDFVNGRFTINKTYAIKLIKEPTTGIDKHFHDKFPDFRFTYCLLIDDDNNPILFDRFVVKSKFKSI